MSRALELARRGIALTHPNPMVGAVLVRDGEVVGEGFHTYESRHHAEIVALEKAGDRARGATLYINLEPCCHAGRTGPCTKALIAGGVRRVVAALKDPNPAVSGCGFDELRQAGVQVEVGLVEEEAKRLNEAFAKWIRTGRPFVTLKTALTLDGQISSGDSSVTWITSPESREQVQQIRHSADALLTGIGTVLADDPRMTDRTGLARRRPLLRVVIDSRLRISLKSNLVKSAANDLLIFTTKGASVRKARTLRKLGAEVVHVRWRKGHADLDQVLAELGRLEMLNVLLEAGTELNGAALQDGFVDKMILFYAPRMLGRTTVPVATFPGRSGDPSAALTNLNLRQVGPDFCVEGYLRDVYGNH